MNRSCADAVRANIAACLELHDIVGTILSAVNQLHGRCQCAQELNPRFELASDSLKIVVILQYTGVSLKTVSPISNQKWCIKSAPSQVAPGITMKTNERIYISTRKSCFHDATHIFKYSNDIISHPAQYEHSAEFQRSMSSFSWVLFRWKSCWEIRLLKEQELRPISQPLKTSRPFSIVKGRCVCQHKYGNTVYVESTVDCTLMVAALKCTPSSVACRSTCMTYWSDHLDEVKYWRARRLHAQDGVFIVPVVPEHPVPSRLGIQLSHFCRSRARHGECTRCN